MYGLYLAFGLLGFACVLLAAASIMTPKTAFFFKKKTRMAACIAWVALTISFFAGSFLFMPDEEREQIGINPGISGSQETIKPGISGK